MMSFDEINYLLAMMCKPEPVEGQKHTWAFDAPPPILTFTPSRTFGPKPQRFPFVRSFDPSNTYPVIKAKRKKMRLVKKYARRYGVRFLRDDIQIRVDMAIISL